MRENSEIFRGAENKNPLVGVGVPDDPRQGQKI